MSSINIKNQRNATYQTIVVASGDPMTGNGDDNNNNGGNNNDNDNASPATFVTKPRVRVATTMSTSTTEPRHGTAKEDAAAFVSYRRQKRPRNDTNPDELDDIDDYNPLEDDDDDDDTNNDTTNKPTATRTAVPNQHELLEAKRQRRLQRTLPPAHINLLDKEDTLVAAAAATATATTDTIRSNQPHALFDEAAALSLATDADYQKDGGVDIEPFHMETEQEDGTGYFEGDTYIFRKRGAEEEPDAWLESLGGIQNDEHVYYYHPPPSSSPDPPHPKSSTDLSTTRRTPNTLEERTPQQLYAQILPYVSDTETILQAIARYGNIMKTHTTSNPKKQRGKTTGTPTDRTTNHATDQSTADSDTDTTAVTMAQTALHQLTEASSALLLKPNHADIYQRTRNDLLRLLPGSEEEDGGDDDDDGNDDDDERNEPNGNNETKSNNHQWSNHHEASHATHNLNAVASSLAPSLSSQVVMWEYQGSHDGAIHGPYTTQQMLQWIQGGYFVGPTAVHVRSVTTTTSSNGAPNKSMQDDLLNDLLEDDEEKQDHENEETGTAGSPPTTVQYSDWMISDQVDFNKYT